MPKPPPINRKWVASHENAAVRENINDLNGLNRPKTTRRTNYEKSNKKAGTAYQ